MTNNTDALVSRGRFLEQIPADADLQSRLALPEARSASIALARAAGFTLAPADLLAPRQAHAPADGREIAAGDEEEIDFDGDGVPDAVKRDGRWVLTTQDY